ncbi:MAG: response regulator [Nitrospirota bacterium]
MTVICECGAKLKISDEKITAAGVRIKCPKCGNPHLVKKPAPAAPAPQADGLAMPWFASSTPSAGKPLVLIAHDSKVVADMIDQVVSEAGYVTAHATDGLEALKKAMDLKPQVMVVDVGLTGIYGFELCERLKGDPDTRGIKIILLSSVYGLTAYKRSPVTLYGADDYIEKHHIPDKLASKIKRLLSGEPIEPPQLPPVYEPVPAGQEQSEPEHAGHRTSPLIRKKGLMVDASPTMDVMRAPDAPAAPASRDREKKPVIPEFPDVMPKVPVTLDSGQKRTIAPAGPAAAQPPRAAEVRPETAPEPPAAKTTPAPAKAKSAEAALQDESVTLDASFFEHEEYDAPVKATPKAAADPEEIEKARRFARLIVSDIALYNQDIVAEGLKNGTFFELLQDDITEGRSLYDNRVPEAIREMNDYYQEAFDDFIAAKKKQR